MHLIHYALVVWSLSQMSNGDSAEIEDRMIMWCLPSHHIQHAYLILSWDELLK